MDKCPNCPAMKRIQYDQCYQCVRDLTDMCPECYGIKRKQYDVCFKCRDNLCLTCENTGQVADKACTCHRGMKFMMTYVERTAPVKKPKIKITVLERHIPGLGN